MFAAHIRQNGDIQTVEDHCRNTAEIASSALSDCNLANAGYLSGLLHDMGKFSKAFNQYITDSFSGKTIKKGSVVHTFAGVKYLLETFHKQSGASYSDISCELIAYAVGAHHGLFDIIDEEMSSGFEYRQENHQEYYQEIKENYFKYCTDEQTLIQYFSLANQEIVQCLQKLKALVDTSNPEANHELYFYTGLLARLLLSAVIEGDRADTSSFMTGKNYHSTIKSKTKPQWDSMLAHLESHITQLTDLETPIGKARKSISEQCKNFSSSCSGLYRLNVPTGGGKTLSAMRFALAHALEKNKNRIIYVAPLISILEQNAQVIRSAIGNPEWVLEHHSNIIREEIANDELTSQELLLEAWDAPVIVTTLVQLLNTIFFYKTSNIRRFHTLANSIIILDEVQTVPTKFLSLFNLAMNFLSGICNTTIILCSATQPCFEKTKHLMRIDSRTPVKLSAEELTSFQRTKLYVKNQISINDIPDIVRSIISSVNSLLVICNKRSEADKLYADLKNENYNCFHLSASMCMENRRDILNALNRSLSESRKGKHKTLCIATQVIEAGVDISFESVARLSAGMDSIIQAAGRCNRNGESSAPSPVYILNCIDESLKHLTEIREGKAATDHLIYSFENDKTIFKSDLASHEAIDYYYHCLYDAMDNEHQDGFIPILNTSLFDLLSYNKRYSKKQNDYFLKQSFKTAGKHFKVFDSDTQEVIVPYKDGKDIIQALLSMNILYHLEDAQRFIRNAKPYTISLYEYEMKQLEKQGALIPLADGAAFALDERYYSEEIGLILNPTNSVLWEV